MSQEFYPTQQIAEHFLARAAGLYGRTIKDVDRDYRMILAYPVPTHVNSVTRAIRHLCREGRIGVCSPRGDFSGQNPELTDPELFSANLPVYRERDVAVLKGRVQPHLPGPNANKLYKHGGLSLMEMLTPWVVLSA